MGNTFGSVFRVTTWGESHGPAQGAVIDGCPAGLAIDEIDIRAQLDRDVPDKELGTPRGETNRFQILSGIFAGKTLGTPISIVVWNNDTLPDSYSGTRDTLRPGHADFTYLARYGHTDWRGGSRASGRECIARLAAGAVARKLASRHGVRFEGRLIELAGIVIGDDESFLRARDRALEIGEGGDSSGGVVELSVYGVPAGVGSPVFDKLQAALGRAFFSIGGVKGVEFGLGFEAARVRGSGSNDPFCFDADGRISTVGNRCGGLLGGISTGGTMTMRLAVKPTPTIQLPQKTVNVAARREMIMEYWGRFDRNYAPRVVPIAEAMSACVLADHLLLSGIVHPTRSDSA
ncbi:MAG: chorismate synthase [Candidatus Riflebacteria bacterium]|nr:chorismate synthase [Candidatus Riflebacteria bacterium]